MPDGPLDILRVYRDPLPRGPLSPAGVDELYRRIGMEHRLTSRKLAAAMGGIVAITVVAIVNAFQPIGDFDMVLKAQVAVAGLAIVGQGALDLWLGLRKSGGVS